MVRSRYSYSSSASLTRLRNLEAGRYSALWHFRGWKVRLRKQLSSTEAVAAVATMPSDNVCHADNAMHNADNLFIPPMLKYYGLEVFGPWYELLNLGSETGHGVFERESLVLIRWGLCNKFNGKRKTLVSFFLIGWNSESSVQIALVFRWWI